MFKEGDIVEIPLRDGRTAFGWILHVSQYFKWAMGFIVLEVCNDSTKPSDLEALCTNLEKLPPSGLLYTASQAATYYRWHVVSSCAISDAAVRLTKRLIGGDVYVGDTRVGQASALDEATLKPMVVSGMIALYAKIEMIYPASQ